MLEFLAMLDFDPLLLNRPLSATSDADPEDVLSAKSAFRRLGYYEMLSYGMTPYPDQPLFDGIRSYQKDKGLRVDGYMLPGGETEQTVNFYLASEYGEGKNDTGDSGCIEPAIQPWQLPWGTPGRWRDYCRTPSERPTKDDCERQAAQDEAACESILNRYGAYRAQRCFASANLRYGNCKA